MSGTRKFDDREDFNLRKYADPGDQPASFAGRAIGPERTVAQIGDGSRPEWQAQRRDARPVAICDVTLSL
jgi:hypothetical protein